MIRTVSVVGAWTAMFLGHAQRKGLSMGRKGK
jgi:hypothetical protein